MNKKVIATVIISIFIGLVWYLFFKKSDYIITFKEKANSGTILQGIEEWSLAQSKIKSHSCEIVDKKLYKSIVTKFISAKDTMLYNWEVSAVNDSVSKVVLGIRHANMQKSIVNRLEIPFGNTNFKVEALAIVSDFRKGLSEHLQKFKVAYNGSATSDEVFVVYLPLESVMQEKAQTMIANDNIISGFIFNNKIKMTGMPYVEITEWNQQKELLKFNYCFPVDKNTPMIADKNVKFKTLKAQKSLKATYFGNFRTSDRAWFTILNQAKKQNLVLNELPIEHYLNNPFYGGNELEWKTEVFIPYRNQN